MTRALFAYRMRPLQLLGLGGAWAVLTAFGYWTVPKNALDAPLDPSLGVMLAGICLGMGVAFVAGGDIDTSEPLVTALPRSYWRTLLLRLAVWLGAGAVTVWQLSERAAAALDVAHRPILDMGLTHLFVAGALAFAGARLFGSGPGAGAALGVYVFSGLLDILWTGMPVHVLADARTHEWAEAQDQLRPAALLLFGLTLLLTHGVTLRRPVHS